MAKPNLGIRRPPDPAAARAFVDTGNVRGAPQTSVDAPGRPEIPPPPGGAATPGLDVHGHLQTPANAPKRPRARRGGIVERDGGRTLRRLTVYLRPELADRFTTWCRANGREMSHAVGEALEGWLKGRR